MAELRRMRPAMGTFLRIHVNADNPAVHAALNGAFERAADLESRFSKFNPDSELNRRAHSPSREFQRLLDLAQEVEAASQGAFDSRCEGRLDLSGIAKGFIVDEICAVLNRRLPGVSGSVNAGGDLRFLNDGENEIHLALGPGRARILRTQARAFATSSFAEALHNPRSTTAYPFRPARGLGLEHTVSVEAPTCALADALTKVGWFASGDVARACADRFQSRIHVFTREGERQESFAAS